MVQQNSETNATLISNTRWRPGRWRSDDVGLVVCGDVGIEGMASIYGLEGLGSLAKVHASGAHVGLDGETSTGTAVVGQFIGKIGIGI